MGIDDEQDDIQELISDYENYLRNGIQPYLDVDDIIDIASYYDDRGRSDEARSALQLGLKLHPGEPEILSFLVRITLVADGDITAAEHYVDEIEQTDNIDYFIAHSDLLIAQNKYDEADKLVEQVIGLFGFNDRSDLTMEVAQMYVFAGQYKRAEHWLGLCPDKESVDYLELYGEVMMSLEKAKEAEATYDKLLDHDAFSLPYWNNITLAQIMQKKYDDAYNSFSYALAISPTDLQALYNRACVSYIQHDYEDAHEILQYLFEVLDDTVHLQSDGQLYASVVSCYANTLSAMNKDDDAIKLLSYASDKITYETKGKIDVMSQLASLYLDRGELNQADDIIEQGIDNTEGEDVCEFCMLKGCLFLERGDKETAAAYFDTISEADYMTDEMMLRICDYYIKCAFYEEASNRLMRLSIERKFTIGTAYLALCFRKMQQNELYLKTLDVACKNCPDEVMTVFGDEIPFGVLPQDYYKYVISHSDKSSEHKRKNKKDEI